MQDSISTVVWTTYFSFKLNKENWLSIAFYMTALQQTTSQTTTSDKLHTKLTSKKHCQTTSQNTYY